MGSYFDAGNVQLYLICSEGKWNVIFQTDISFYLGGAKKFLWPDAYLVFLVTWTRTNA